MTATTTTSTWKPSHAHSQSRSSHPTTTPRGYPAVSSVGQTMPPQLSPLTGRSPPSHKTSKSTSPGYFGLAVNDESMPPDSNPGQHTKQNWKYSTSSRESVAASPRYQSNETNPSFEAFRRQSENYGFSFNNNNSVGGLRKSSNTSAHTPNLRLSEKSQPTPGGRWSHNANDQSDSTEQNLGKRSKPEVSFFDMPKNDSPVSLSPVPQSVTDHQQARLSLPASDLQPQLAALKKKQRSETVPVINESSGPSMAVPGEVARILETQSDEVLLLDLRVYPQYAASRIRGALNLCIPTTLLKRPSFTVQKLAETFNSQHDKGEFAKWETSAYIIVYDANSMLAKEAIMPLNVLKKFTTLGWKGQGLVIKGGFQTFAKSFPDLVQHGAVTQGQGSSTQPVPTSGPNQDILPVAGGCSMPATKSAANPFFGNIRQNMDLMDGVGQMPIKKPAGMSERDEKDMPAWLRRATTASDEGKQVSDKFLHIERGEQKRMQQALTGNVSYGTPSKEASDRIQVAGIEKGTKNRYNNIFPYDHSRVKLQGVLSEGCDYVNASYVQASYTSRRYIATQAPIPATFEDFWKMVWQQDVRVIVMLTAESEGGQVKSHPYWKSGDYGPFKVKQLQERLVTLDKHKQTPSAASRPTLGTRRSTQPNTLGEKKHAESQKVSGTTEAPMVTVRHFTLSHSAQPFRPMREVTQLQYTQWPDFGAPASPTAILGLIEQVNKYVRSSSSPSSRSNVHENASANQYPIMVHCSAGCGRTGTFCTIDSVIDMLKQQQSEVRTRHRDAMEVDVPDDWLHRDDIDLVAKTVDDFRHQRLSMVQNLRQFVLCYESILQWLYAEGHDEAKPAKERRGHSFQGSVG